MHLNTLVKEPEMSPNMSIEGKDMDFGKSIKSNTTVSQKPQSQGGPRSRTEKKTPVGEGLIEDEDIASEDRSSIQQSQSSPDKKNLIGTN